MAKKDVDIEEEIQRLAHKSNVNIKKSEFAFENQLKKLDTQIDNLSKKKMKEFEKNKELVSKYLEIDYNEGTIERYREKLNKI